VRANRTAVDTSTLTGGRVTRTLATARPTKTTSMTGEDGGTREPIFFGVEFVTGEHRRKIVGGACRRHDGHPDTDQSDHAERGRGALARSNLTLSSIAHRGDQHEAARRHDQERQPGKARRSRT
jgi:hypothetical protein